MLQDIRYAWAAGFFDGEGTIAFPNSGLMIACGQRVREPLLVLQTLFEGSVQEITVVRSCPMWYCYGYKARWALEQMLPHMVVKKAQAELAIEWVLIGQGQGHKLDPEDSMRRAAIVEEIKALKRPWLKRSDPNR